MPKDGLVDCAMAVLAQADMKTDELAEFTAALAKAAGIGLRAVQARIAEEQRRRRHQAQQNVAAISAGDGRMVRPRPEPDGELTPIVMFLDQIFADGRDEPPMRNASGNLVEVRVREPWAMQDPLLCGPWRARLLERVRR
jgi:hypothetical protein